MRMMQVAFYNIFFYGGIIRAILGAACIMYMRDVLFIMPKKVSSIVRMTV